MHVWERVYLPLTRGKCFPLEKSWRNNNFAEYLWRLVTTLEGCYACIWKRDKCLSHITGVSTREHVECTDYVFLIDRREKTTSWFLPCLSFIFIRRWVLLKWLRAVSREAWPRNDSYFIDLYLKFTKLKIFDSLWILII